MTNEDLGHCPYCGEPVLLIPDNSYGSILIGCGKDEKCFGYSRAFDKSDLEWVVVACVKRAVEQSTKADDPYTLKRSEASLVLAKQIIMDIARDHGIYPSVGNIAEIEETIQMIQKRRSKD